MKRIVDYYQGIICQRGFAINVHDIIRTILFSPVHGINEVSSVCANRMNPKQGSHIVQDSQSSELP